MKQCFYFLMVALVGVMVGCGPVEGPEPQPEPVPEVKAALLSLSFKQADNGEAVWADVHARMGQGSASIYTPMVRSVDNLVATFTTDGVGVYVGDKEQVSRQTPNDFTSPVTYRVVSSSGHEYEYVVSVATSELPVVVINTPGKALVPPKTEDWLAGTELQIILKDGTVDYHSEVANIRGRGNSTWSFPKKPYALKLNEKASILGMPKHKRWVLLANWLDRTSMRNHIAFHIAKQTDLDWTPRGEFVEVVLNGKHKGTYYLCEQIKVDENRVNISDLTDEDPSGGFLMELDVYFDEAYKFHSSVYGLPYMFKDPDEVTEAQQSFMQDYITTLEWALYDDGRFAEREYVEYLDVDSFIDWWFVHELTGNSEPYHPKSTYMHKDRGGLLKAGPVWDFDWETFVPYKTSGYVIQGAVYYGRLFQDEAFVARVKERWALLKPRFDAVADFIDSEAERLAPAIKENMVMWPIDVVVNQDESLSFEAAVDRMKTSYKNKLNWLNRHIENM